MKIPLSVIAIIAGIIQIVLIMARITGYIDSWPWGLVWSPTWIPLCLMIVWGIYTFMFIAFIFLHELKKSLRKHFEEKSE